MDVSPEQITGQLAKILASPAFQGAPRSRAMLEFLVNEAAAGRADDLKEYTIGAQALGRGDDFDPRSDSIVRAEASRLRSRLERYYATEGRADVFHIVLPKGSYLPQFVPRPPEDEASQPEDVRPSSRSARFVWLAAAAVGVIASALTAVWAGYRADGPERPPLQVDVEVRVAGIVGSEVGPDFAISADGTRLAVVSLSADGVAHLNMRRLDQIKVTELPGTEGARGPFFSPDGAWIGFWADGNLKKIASEGGSPVILCGAADLLGAGWGNDGNIVAAIDRGKLSRIPSAGGAPQVVLDLTKDGLAPTWPQILPGGEVLVTVRGTQAADQANIEAVTLATGERKVLMRGGTYGRYLPNGYLVYVNQGTVFAQSFDVGKLQTQGDAVALPYRVAYSSEFGFAQMDFSLSGTMVNRRSNLQMAPRWIHERGGQDRLMKPGSYIWPTISPDGRRLAVMVTESGGSSVWIQEGQPDRITRLPSPASYPVWTPDGRFIVLGSNGGLGTVRSDGSGKIEPLMDSRFVQVPWSFSPDGTRLAYAQLDPETAFDLWTVPIVKSGSGIKAGRAEPYLRTKAYETYPAFSPDGRWMAYGSNESGSWEVYVRSFPDSGRKVQVSSGGGRLSHWSSKRPPNGELFYQTDSHRIMLVSYDVKGSEFSVRSVRPWSQARFADAGVFSFFDVSADGRLVALVPDAADGDQQTENHLTFVFNFFDEVRRRVQ